MSLLIMKQDAHMNSEDYKEGDYGLDFGFHANQILY